MSNERHFQKHRLVDEYLEPSLVAIACSAQTELGISSSCLVDERGYAELLDKAQQLASRCRALREVDEVGLDATLGEESQRLSRLGTLLYTEDLNVHACKLDIMERQFRSGLDSATHFVSRTSEYTYTPAWWVPGAHPRTLWGKIVRRRPLLTTRIERWPTPDGDEIELHRLDPVDRASANGGRLLVLHGLEGTIRSHYLLGILAQARKQGWAADALIFRTCNGEVTRSRRLYHSGETTDLDFVVERLVREHPGQPLALAGFSLGGNVLLKWLGERGDNLPPEVRSAAAVSVPFDLERGARFIERGFSRVYTRHFLRTLRSKARAKLARDPGLFDGFALERAKTLFAFDDAVTAPVHGFADARDYYRRSSSIGFLPSIRRPTLLLSAYDDPFLPSDVLRDVAAIVAANPCITVEFHHRGGHVGFISGSWPWSPRYYAEDRVLAFLRGAC